MTKEVDRVKYKKAMFGGGRSVIYQCPKCKGQLETAVSEMPQGDECPDCRVKFSFSSNAKNLVREAILKEKQAEEQASEKKLQAKLQKERDKKLKAEERSKQQAADAAAKEKEQQIRRLEKSQLSWAKRGGIVAVGIGLLITVASFSADTTVSTGTSLGRVHNIGKMNQQRNGIILGFVLSAVGVGLLVVHRNAMANGGIKFDRRLDRLCPKCGEPIKRVATLCRHCNSEIEKDIDF